jgi:hypothetical protein
MRSSPSRLRPHLSLQFTLPLRRPSANEKNVTKLNNYAEQNPIVAALFSVFSFFMGLLQWLVDHADAFTKIGGMVCMALGVAAGWYALRINRRKFQLIEKQLASGRPESD